MPISKVYWCSYYNRYICSDCVADEFSVIPAFIFKFWNFKKFPISKQAKIILDKWFDKPVIYIKSSDRILKISTLFRQAVILRRKIHKIFDLMKYECTENFVTVNLGKYKYFVLKENLFSLKDMCDIHDYTLIKKLREFLKKFENHLLRECKVLKYIF